MERYVWERSGKNTFSQLELSCLVRSALLSAGSVLLSWFWSRNLFLKVNSSRQRTTSADRLQKTWVRLSNNWFKQIISTQLSALQQLCAACRLSEKQKQCTRAIPVILEAHELKFRLFAVMLVSYSTWCAWQHENRGIVFSLWCSYSGQISFWL